MVAHAEMARATSALTDLKGMSLILVCFANALCIGVLTVVFFNSWHALVLFVQPGPEPRELMLVLSCWPSQGREQMRNC